jgi:C4-dicarboxylate-specific signal transduction histidine kinase
LTVLLSYADLARVARGPGELEDCLRNIRAAGERAASLTAQLLTFAKKRVGTARVVDVRESLAETESPLRRLIGEAHPPLDQLPRECRSRASRPRQRLQQVLLNLAVNARGAMGSERLGRESPRRCSPSSQRPFAESRSRTAVIVS